MIIGKNTLSINTASFGSKKIDSNYNNFYISHKYSRSDNARNKIFGPNFLRLLLYIIPKQYEKSSDYGINQI